MERMLLGGLSLRSLFATVHEKQAGDDGDADSQHDSAEVTRCLNIVVSDLWPHVRQHAEQLLRRHVQPAVEGAVRMPVVGGVSLCDPSLGDAPPTVVGAHLRPVPEGGVRLDTQVEWRGDVGFHAQAGVASAGVSSVCLDGTLSLILRPPLPHPPFFGAAEVFFPNAPAVSLGFAGLAQVVHLPGLSDFASSAVESALSSHLVLPQRTVVPLVKDQGTVARNPPPCGVLRLRVASYTGSGSMVRVRVGGVVGMQQWETVLPGRGAAVLADADAEDTADVEEAWHDLTIWDTLQQLSIEIRDAPWMPGVGLSWSDSATSAEGSVCCKDVLALNGDTKTIGLQPDGVLVLAYQWFTPSPLQGVTEKPPLLMVTCEADAVDGLQSIGGVPPLRLQVSCAAASATTRAATAAAPLPETVQRCALALKKADVGPEQAAESLDLDVAAVRAVYASADGVEPAPCVFDDAVHLIIENDDSEEGEAALSDYVLVPHCLSVAIVDSQNTTLAACSIPLDAPPSRVCGPFPMHLVGTDRQTGMALRGRVKVRGLTARAHTDFTP